MVVERLMKALTGMGFLAALLAGCSQQKPVDANAAADAQQLQDLRDAYARLQAEREKDAARLAELERENGQLKADLSRLGSEASGSPAPGWKTIPGGAMVALDGQVLFDSGKNILKPSGRKTLDNIAATLKAKYPDYDIYVFGHTDTQPIRHSGWKDNYELSCERALSVVRYLMSKGIKPNNLAACGWGEYRPVAKNSTAAERAFNRRVEIFAMAPHGTRVADSAGKSSPPAP